MNESIYHITGVMPSALMPGLDCDGINSILVCPWYCRWCQ